ncbi:hypothetical protein [Candidatus Kuenenia stuttgartiensis]|uniref:hypothetical protein n=1 Tax=Kuenenia stuttgartiensis TaxID=174633 RepID=UPI00146B7048|nr:hypothetical protein [Candidatus Kuenenia stuttgartiensis]
MNRQERNAVRKSLNVSIRDGIAAAATSGFGNNYVNPFAVALGGTNIQIGVLNSIIHFIPRLCSLRQRI